MGPPLLLLEALLEALQAQMHGTTTLEPPPSPPRRQQHRPQPGAASQAAPAAGGSPMASRARAWLTKTFSSHDAADGTDAAGTRAPDNRRSGRTRIFLETPNFPGTPSIET